MNSQLIKPYIIIPKLIGQATWGGSFIKEMKGWEHLPFLEKFAIGQSYEIYSGTNLFTAATTTSDERFMPEIGNPDTPAIHEDLFTLREHVDYESLSTLIDTDPRLILGDHVVTRYGIMPLLIKVNHARGNSFQLHVKYGTQSTRWQAKPESWFYLQDGMLTCGLKQGASVADYKDACIEINTFMQSLSAQCVSKSISLDEAKADAKNYITRVNPWQFVNVVDAKRHDLYDMSAGGVHHSWEEDNEKYPLGNVIYEVQLDKMDPVSTIRSFDQGKILSNGTIRQIHIEDFFTYVDTDQQVNDPSFLKQTRVGDSILSTRFYSVNYYEGSQPRTIAMQDSFHHVFVETGSATVEAGSNSVSLTQGHGCFIPAAAGTFIIHPSTDPCAVIDTWVP